MILSGLGLLAGVFFIILCCRIIKKDKLKKEEGIEIYGEWLEYWEVMGQPNRYVVKVKFERNGDVKNKKIVTTDKSIMSYKGSKKMPFIYVESNDNVYWQEVNEINMTVSIIILAAMAAAAFIFSITELLITIL
ncbi:MAG: hypothetical protein ACI4GW_06550 [Lachnospiraceae bacterium]